MASPAMVGDLNPPWTSSTYQRNRAKGTRRTIAENNDDITTASTELSLAFGKADGGRKGAYFVEN